MLPWVHNAGFELFSRRDGHRAVCLTSLSYLPTVLAVCEIFVRFFVGALICAKGLERMGNHALVYGASGIGMRFLGREWLGGLLTCDSKLPFLECCVSWMAG